MTRAEILKQIVLCLDAVSAVRSRTGAVTEKFRLAADFNLAGRGLLQVGELLELEFEITVLPADLINVALAGATVRNLVDLVEERLHAA